MGRVLGHVSHDDARSRVYRWGEDGLLGSAIASAGSASAWCVERQGFDPQGALFGLTGSEGNHSEDCKELYYFLDATPTSSYLKALYKYPRMRSPTRSSSTRRGAVPSSIPSSRSRTPACSIADTGTSRSSTPRIVRRHPGQDHHHQPRRERGDAAPAAAGLAAQHVVVGSSRRGL